MTKEEAILISAYTGFLLTHDFSDVQRFCEELLGRPILTHELSAEETIMEIRGKCMPLILDLIENEGTIDPEILVKRVRWDIIPNMYISVASKDGSHSGNVTSCSCCQEVNPNSYKTNYCPNCGAKMEEITMPGKCRPSLRAKTLENVERSNLCATDKACIRAVFERYEAEIENRQPEDLSRQRRREGTS